MRQNTIRALADAIRLSADSLILSIDILIAITIAIRIFMHTFRCNYPYISDVNDSLKYRYLGGQ